ncbi:hypothetical protein FRC01_010586, partial [Tulasnella sp. 417]
MSTPPFIEWLPELHASGPVATKSLLIAASIVTIYKIVGHALREYLIIPRTTILKDIDSLHMPREGEKIPGRAVVCGGSIAGILAAAVCADHFESVLVIEAETWTNEHGTELPKIEDRVHRTTSSGYQTATAPRTRVMQYYFSNFFQPPVYRAFTRLFPNIPRIIKELNLGSAVLGARLRMCFGGIDLPDPDPSEEGIADGSITACLSREATEVVLRKAIRESRPNVTFKTGTVSGFLKDGPGLAGVTVRVNGAEEQVQGDFVVDAAGPSQMSYSKWLSHAGFSVPSDLRLEYDAILRYTATTWTIPPHLHSKWPAPWGFKCGLVYTMSCDAESGDPKVLGFTLVENNQ